MPNEWRPAPREQNPFPRKRGKAGMGARSPAPDADPAPPTLSLPKAHRNGLGKSTRNVST